MTLEYIIHESAMQDCFLLWMDDSRIKKKAHSQFDSTRFEQNESMQVD